MVCANESCISGCGGRKEKEGGAENDKRCDVILFSLSLPLQIPRGGGR